MDYPFFIGRLCVLQSDGFKALQRRLAPLKLSPSTYFISQQDVLTAPVPDTAHPVGLLEHLERFGLLRSKIKTLAVNEIPAGGVIQEHSDIEGRWPFNYRKAHHHIVHIPLSGDFAEVEYTHRRDLALPQSVTTLQGGGVYLYNNYVKHAVFNKGQLPRRNLIIDYEDYDWATKNHMLTLFGSNDPANRYANRDVYPEIAQSTA